MNDHKIARQLLRMAKAFVGARLRINPQSVNEGLHEAISEMVELSASAEVSANWSGSYYPGDRDSPPEYPELDELEFESWSDLKVSPRRLPLGKFLVKVADNFYTRVDMTSEEIAKTKVFIKAVQKELSKGILIDAVEDVYISVTGANGGGNVDLEEAFMVYGKISGSSVSFTIKPAPDAERRVLSQANDFELDTQPQDHDREPDEPMWDDDGEVEW